MTRKSEQSQSTLDSGSRISRMLLNNNDRVRVMANLINEMEFSFLDDGFVLYFSSACLAREDYGKPTNRTLFNESFCPHVND